jgi:hypothetical protein
MRSESSQAQPEAEAPVKFYVYFTVENGTTEELKVADNWTVGDLKEKCFYKDLLDRDGHLFFKYERLADEAAL